MVLSQDAHRVSYAAKLKKKKKKTALYCAFLTERSEIVAKLISRNCWENKTRRGQVCLPLLGWKQRETEPGPGSSPALGLVSLHSPGPLWC